MHHHDEHRLSKTLKKAIGQDCRSRSRCGWRRRVAGLRARSACYAVLLFGLLGLTNCSRTLYRVAVPLVAPPPVLAPLADSPKLLAGARLLTGDESLAQFEANLPLAQVIVIELRVSNAADQPLMLATLRTELADAQGRGYRPLPPAQALQRVMKYYGNRVYAPEAVPQTTQAYESVAFAATGALIQQQERRGFLFYEAPPAERAAELRPNQLAFTLWLNGNAHRLALQ